MEPPEPCAEPAAFGDTLHIHYSVRGLGGRGGAWGGGALQQHVSFSLDTWQAVRESLRLWGSCSTWPGEGRSSSLLFLPACFSASSSRALRSEGWRDLREAPALSAPRGMLGSSRKGVADRGPGVCAPCWEGEVLGVCSRSSFPHRAAW